MCISSVPIILKLEGKHSIPVDDTMPVIDSHTLLPATQQCFALALPQKGQCQRQKTIAMKQ
jgi:hypothetical protein